MARYVVDLSQVPVGELLEAVEALSSNDDLGLLRLVIDPSEVTVEATSRLATYLRSVPFLNDLEFTRIRTDQVSGVEHHVVGGILDVLLHAAAANNQIDLGSFAYGSVPTASPAIFQLFTRAKLSGCRIFVDLHHPVEGHMFDRMLQDMRGLRCANLKLGEATDMATLGQTLSRYHLKQHELSLCCADDTICLDTSPIVRSLSPMVRSLTVEVDFYATFGLGRQLLVSPKVPGGLWANVFARYSADEADELAILYFLLRHKIDLLGDSLARGVARGRV